MRVTDMMDTVLSAVWQAQNNEQTAVTQLSSGKRVNRPSDDPAAAAADVLNQDQQSQVDEFLQSTNSLNSLFQTADSALSTTVTALNQAVSLGTEGANGTLSASDLQSVTASVQGVLSQVLQMANTSYQGSYIFGGTATTSAPFSNTAGGVVYTGNGGLNQASIADGRSIQTNVPGSQLFMQPGSDVLGSLHQLITALQSGNSTAISNATTSVSTALNYLSGQRVFYGNAMSQISDDQTTLNQESTDLKSQENTLVGADMAQAALAVTQAQTDDQAVLAAAAKVLPVTLLDYLK
jgi:flagellar hook-associated protein 3 FlgL